MNTKTDKIKPYSKISVPSKETNNRGTNNNVGSKTAKKTAKKTVRKTGTTNRVRKVTKKVTNKVNDKVTKKSKTKKDIKITFLGGLGEIGKNMTLFEYDDEMILLDCGLAFPDDDMLGVDLVLPDFSYVKKNADKIKAIFITHGHEDHIGGLAYLFRDVKIPVYGTRLTLGLIEGKLREKRLLSSIKLHEIKAGDVQKFKHFQVEAIHVNHSIPDAVGYALKTPAGTVVHTGDFKIDTTPIDGGMIDISRFAELGKQGVLAMMSDSTNAERPGYSISESAVGNSFEKLFAKAGKRRIIVATFASNIHRVQQIINEAAKLRRKVVLVGRSLENVFKIGAELGYLDVPKNTVIPLQTMNQYPSDQLVIISTGSQGEPMSALYRMAMGEHKKINISPNDYIIISATPIPGNEKTVGRVINELLKLGAKVVYENMYEVHVSGHAYREELKMMLSIIKPKYFFPVHGETKHLSRHRDLALSVGMDPKNVLIPDNGTKVSVTENRLTALGTVPAGRVYVDGYGIGDVGNIVLRDRKKLSEDGIIIIMLGLAQYGSSITMKPEIISRGFVYVKESENLIDEIRDVALSAVNRCFSQNVRDHNAIKNKVKEEVSKFLYNKTRREPIILPIVVEA